MSGKRIIGRVVGTNKDGTVRVESPPGPREDHQRDDDDPPNQFWVVLHYDPKSTTNIFGDGPWDSREQAQALADAMNRSRGGRRCQHEAIIAPIRFDPVRLALDIASIEGALEWNDRLN